MSLLTGLAIGGIATSALSSFLNYAESRRNLDWQKYAQRKTWDRDDMSIQRRVADLKAAGLSPVLAAGQGATSGPVVQTKSARFDDVGVSEKAQAAMSMLQQGANVSRTNAEIKLINQQVKNARDQGQNIRVDSLLKNVSYAQKIHDYDANRRAGTASNAGSFGKTIRDVTNILERPGGIFDKRKFRGHGSTGGW